MRSSVARDLFAFKTNFSAAQRALLPTCQELLVVSQFCIPQKLGSFFVQELGTWAKKLFNVLIFN